MSNTTSDGLNYLGTFSVIDEVYAVYPSGGVPGNFVIVDGEVLYWNEDLMRWTSRDSDSDTEGDSTVNGTLTADEVVIKDGFRTSDFINDTKGSALRKINGKWLLSVDDIRVRDSDHFKGQSSFTSVVFTRRSSKPSAPTGGSYSHPLPEETAWKDGVPNGTLPVWMSRRVFTSDELPPQQDAWSDPVMMIDDETTDIEFSPASAESVPDAPDSTNRHDGSGTQIWFDPVLDPNADWTAMNWMAIATKSLDGEGNEVWSDWTIALIKGEKGDDGANGENGIDAVFIKTNRDAIVIDCDASGNIIGNHTITINAELYRGDERLTPVASNSSFSFGGITNTPTVTNKTASSTFTFSQGTPLSSGTIQVTLRDYVQSVNPDSDDSSDNRHSATKSISVIAARRGATGIRGDDGDPGAVPMYCSWEIGKSYKSGASGESVFHIAVLNGNWYRCIRSHTSLNTNSPISGNASTYWQQVDDLPFLLVEEGVIKMLHSQMILMNDGNGNPTASINHDSKGSYAILYKSGRKRMELREDGYLCYYNDDADNSLAWKLGHGGTIVTGDDWQPIWLSKLTNGLSTSVTRNTTFALDEYWQFKAGGDSANSQYDGLVYPDSNDTPPADVTGATPVDDGYYTPNSHPNHIGLLYQITVYRITDGVIEEGTLDSNGNTTFLED